MFPILFYWQELVTNLQKHLLCKCQTSFMLTCFAHVIVTCQRTGFMLTWFTRYCHMPENKFHVYTCSCFFHRYRLAPGDKFPALFDDCITATRYLLRNAKDFGVDASRIAVAGKMTGQWLLTYSGLKYPTYTTNNTQCIQLVKMGICRGV